MSFADYQASLVRLYDGRRTAVGAGCLVGPDHVVTCAHVVSAALGASERDIERPTGEIEMDLPLVPGQPALKGSVVHWVPVLGDEQGDIALVALTAPAPEPARPVRLVPAGDVWEHGFRAYGFPAGAPGGEWASGRMLATQATGWVQLEAVRAEGGRVERGYSGGPVWDDSLGGVVGIVVAARKAAELRMAYLIPSAELLRVCGPFVPDMATVRCPYQGLAAFREEHAGVFFGREEATGRLVAATAQRPLLALLGASGSGKSSVVFAGLVPALRRSGRWEEVDLRPGRQPFESLAAALVPLLLPDLGPASVLERLQATPEVAKLIATLGLPAVLRQLTATLGGRRLLIVVDQFEELFTLCGDAEARVAFIDALLDAAGAAGAEAEPTVVFLVTMRADFLGQALAHRPLADALQGTDEKLGPMTTDELRQAIERPASASGVRFEDGLVSRILDDLRAEPGQLPLLEFALTLLWEQQRAGTLTHEGYEAVGRVDHALAIHADSVYLSLAPEDQERARRVFVQLVKPGEGTEDTRRLASAADLPGQDWELVRRLATKRLVVTDRDTAGAETAEVAHEALIRGWSRLQDWLTTDRDFRIWQERLRDAARLWEARGQDEAVLLRGLLLVEAEEWLVRRPEEVSPAEQQFVALSRRRQDEQAARYQELYQAASARELAARADLLRGGDLAASELAVLLAIEAVRRHPSFDTDLALRRAIAGLGKTEAESRGWPLEALDVTASVEPYVVRVRNGDRVEVMAISTDCWVHAATVSADGRLVAAALDDRTARIWTMDGQEVRRFLHGSLVNAVAFSPDGRLLATAGDDGAAHLWDLGTGSELHRFPHAGLVNAVVFCPDGARLATAGQDGQARIWDVERGTELVRLPAVGDQPAIGFNETGDYLGCGTSPVLSSWWPLQPEALVRNASQLVGRELTPAELEAYVGVP